MNKNWEGSTEQFVEIAEELAIKKDLINYDQRPNVRLVRDYVSRGILSKPRKEGKEVIFGYTQLIEFLACRALIKDGWPLKKIADDFQKSTHEEIILLVPGEAPENDSLKLIKSFSESTKPAANFSASSPRPSIQSLSKKSQPKRTNRILGMFDRGSKPLAEKNELFETQVTSSNDYEPHMTEKHLSYFKSKLMDWKKSILSENKDTIKTLKAGKKPLSDLTDRASEEADRALELRTRDRQRKLIKKIDEALYRIEVGSYGYCEETGEPISLKRLDARPIATLSVEAQERHERREKQFDKDVLEKKPVPFSDIKSLVEVAINASDNIGKSRLQIIKDLIVSEPFKAYEKEIVKEFLNNEELSRNRFRDIALENKELEELTKVLGRENSRFEFKKITNIAITDKVSVQIENLELKKMTREKARAIAKAIELNLIKTKNREDSSND